MEDRKFLEACKIYKEKVYPLAEQSDYAETYKHILYMLWRIPWLIEAGRKEKANRWLGFVQGALWANDIYTIEEMKEHNRP